MANRPSRYHERLFVVLTEQQKARVVALADRENTSIGAIVRRALSRELRELEAA